MNQLRLLTLVPSKSKLVRRKSLIRVEDTIGEASLDNETNSTPSPERQLQPRKTLMLVP